MAFPVIARQNTPPGSPASGARYLVGNAPTGAWSGHANKFAVWQTSLWTFRMPVEGETTYDQTANEHLFFDGTAWTPFTLGGGSGSGASSDANNFLFVRSSVGIMNRTGLDWFQQTSGPNATTETVNGSQWILLRIPQVTGGGSHFSVRWWNAPSGDKTITARIIPQGASVGSPSRFKIALRNPGNRHFTFGADFLTSSLRLASARWNSAWGGPEEETMINQITTWFDRWRIVISGNDADFYYNTFGVWMFHSRITHADVPGTTQVGLMIQRGSNADTMLYCDEFTVTT